MGIPANLKLRRKDFAALLLHPNRIFTALLLLQASINADVNQGFSKLSLLLGGGKVFYSPLFTDGEEFLPAPYNHSVADLLQIPTVLNFPKTLGRPQKSPFQSLQGLSQRMEQANPSPRH